MFFLPHSKLMTLNNSGKNQQNTEIGIQFWKHLQNPRTSSASLDLERLSAGETSNE